MPFQNNKERKKKETTRSHVVHKGMQTALKLNTACTYIHAQKKKKCLVSSYYHGKGRCNIKYSKLLDLSSSDYTPVQGSFGPHYTYQCATYKNATICSLILLNEMQMIKQTVVLEKKKKLCAHFLHCCCKGNNT